MANPEHVSILEKGVEAWNQWREDHPDVQPDLSDIETEELQLPKANFSGANLKGAVFYKANLEGADLEEADLMGFAHFTHANLAGANLRMASMIGTNLRHSSLRGANLKAAKLILAKLEHADLRQADLAAADLRGAELVDADLRGANLLSADLSANLQRANLTGADLTRATMVNADVEDAIFTDCLVFSINVWDLSGVPRDQTDLVITPRTDPAITVDNLKVAQFIYLMLNNEEIRDVIDTVTSKAVLILGRFTDHRKPTLLALRSALRNRGLVPILFDFTPSESRDLTETVQLLANMSRFVIADVTDAKSIPQELSAIIPHMPSVPVQPIILVSKREYAMFEHWRSFLSVLPEYAYESQDHLIETLEAGVIAPVQRWEDETDKAKAKERMLRDQVQAQRAEIAALKERLARG